MMVILFPLLALGLARHAVVAFRSEVGIMGHFAFECVFETGYFIAQVLSLKSASCSQY